MKADFKIGKLDRILLNVTMKDESSTHDATKSENWHIFTGRGQQKQHRE